MGVGSGLNPSLLLPTVGSSTGSGGPASGGGQFIEVVIDEAPLRQAMYRFSRNLLLVSLGWLLILIANGTINFG